MKDIALALATFIAGIVVTHYYFIRSTRTRLTPYVLGFGRALETLNEVRHRLTVKLDGIEVKHLHFARLLFVNDGDRAIRGTATPLRILLPQSARFVEVAVVYARPSELVYKISNTELPDGSTAIDIQFPLLNTEDALLVRVLWDGEVALDAWRFQISSEGLPPLLSPKLPPYHFMLSSGQEEEQLRVNWKHVRLGATITILAVAFSVVVTLRMLADELATFKDYMDYLGPLFLFLMVAAGGGLFTYAAGIYWPKIGRRFHIPDEIKKSL